MGAFDLRERAVSGLARSFGFLTVAQIERASFYPAFEFFQNRKFVVVFRVTTICFFRPENCKKITKQVPVECVTCCASLTYPTDTAWFSRAFQLRFSRAFLEFFPLFRRNFWNLLHKFVESLLLSKIASFRVNLCHVASCDCYFRPMPEATNT